MFVLPPTLVRFLVGLQIAPGFSFNINLRLHNKRQLHITEWNAKLQLKVNSHVWLPLKPLNNDPDDFTPWDPLIQATMLSSECQTIFAFPVSPPSIKVTKKNPPLPWKRDRWNSNMNDQNIPRLHEVFEHRSPSAMLDLHRRQSCMYRLLSAHNHRNAKPCNQNAPERRLTF